MEVDDGFRIDSSCVANGGLVYLRTDFQWIVMAPNRLDRVTPSNQPVQIRHRVCPCPSEDDMNAVEYGIPVNWPRTRTHDDKPVDFTEPCCLTNQLGTQLGISQMVEGKCT